MVAQCSGEAALSWDDRSREARVEDPPTTNNSFNRIHFTMSHGGGGVEAGLFFPL